MVEKVGTYGIRKNILIGQESYYLALPAIITGTASDVILAGTPLAGDITDRDTGFTVVDKVTVGEGQNAVDTYPAVGVLLHDVTLDSDGNANGTIVLAGCVDLLKLDENVVTLIETVTEGLEKIIFVEGSAY